MLAMASIFAVAFTIGGYVADAAAPSQNSLYCGFTLQGRSGCHGYVTNIDFYIYNASDPSAANEDVNIFNVSNPSDNALPANINSAASFESLYETYLARGSSSNYDYDSFGAAVTIDSMLGVTGPAVCQWYTSNASTTTCTWSAAVAYAQDPSHLNDWAARINYYASKGWIIWNQTIFKPYGYPDSGHVCNLDAAVCWRGAVLNPPVLPADDARDIAVIGTDVDTYGISNAIVFTGPSGTQFALDRFCGNFLGQLQALTSPAPPATASCAGFTASVAAPDPNRPFTLQASVRYNPADGATTAFGPDTMVTTLSGPSPYRTISQMTTSPSISDDVAIATLNVPATHVSGTFTLTWQVTGSQAPTITCASSLTVALQPYFTVTGGDVSAGQGFGSSCTDNPAADIKGVNRDNGATPADYFGAGSSQAALATGSIAGFSSDLTNDVTNNLGGSTDGLAEHLPGGLIGSNAAPGSSEYGGHFLGASTGNWCVPDYADSVTAKADYTSVPNWSSLAPGSYVVKLSGDHQLGGITLPAGVHVTAVVTGSVYLTGNITYASYGSLTDIPQFDLLVSGGNIFIDPSVTELHGFYDAQPTNATTGAIYTCATGNSITDVIKGYSQCAQQLTIYGAVAAKQIVFDRTGGSITPSGSVADTPAEHIVYTPELWLGSQTAPTTSCSQEPTQSQCLYQSYTSLPPVL